MILKVSDNLFSQLASSLDSSFQAYAVAVRFFLYSFTQVAFGQVSKVDWWMGEKETKEVFPSYP